MKEKTLGCLFSVSEPDARYLDGMLKQLTWLGFPFAVNFDHCSPWTKRQFKEHPLYLGGFENDDPEKLFDESHRQTALEVVIKAKMDWALRFDIDEVLDHRAPQIIPEIMEMDTDMVWCPCLDMWGDDKHYRVDGMFGPEMNPDAQDVLHKQFRKMFYNLHAGKWVYMYGDVHSPMLFHGEEMVRAPRMIRSRLHVIHYGLMSYIDTAFKAKRWREIYTRRMGHFPYDHVYDYMNDRSVKVELRDFDYDTWEGQ